MGIVKTWATFHEDPGHGWLEVSVTDVHKVGLTEHSFSTCSYIHRVFGQETRLYLEEDVDAAIYILAWEEKHGPWSEHAHVQGIVHSHEAWIRRLDHTTGRDYVTPSFRKRK